ncbi:CU044_2847 family protein [Streptomyces capillispiralis]|uniref:CU044_2847 family protein n=1 Tax=Streptomyces capillispiralis TaxID=68182 RepID=UPI001E36DB20|nr:CU044_2847 family protein [Streptomyces capillispiralis]
MYTVDVPLGSGGEIVRVQVNDAGEDIVRVGRGSRTVARAEQSLEQMLDVVRPVADAFVGRCRGMLQPPDEATLAFGMSLSADAKVLVAGSSAEANFSVSLTWHSSPAGTDAVPEAAPGPESAGRGPEVGPASEG